MLTDKPYSRSHFEALLPTEEREGVRIDDSGVWPATDYEAARRLGLLPEYKALSWKPVFAYSGDVPAPDTKNTPALPFPFDARDLAAFMLAGVGSFFVEFYGEWKDGPDEDALAEIDPGDSYARKAVNEAYSAYRDALARVGASDACLDEATRKLCRSSPKVRGVDWVQAQEKQEEAHEAWLRAMVSELLRPAAHQAPQQDARVCNRQAPTPFSAVGASSSTSSVKFWTPEKLTEAKDRREKYGTKETAKYYGVTVQRIRRLLPSDKANSTGYSAFTHRPK